MANDSRREIYYQDNVTLSSARATYINFINTAGTLIFYENLESRSKQIDWKPNDVTIESISDNQEPDWALVTVAGRPRTISSGDSNLRPKTVTIIMDEVKSFRISRNSQKLTFRDGKGETLCAFLFHPVNCDVFVGILKSHLRTAPSRRDKHLFIMLEDLETPESQRLDKSFAELQLFTEQPSMSWNFIRNIQNRPYESAMSAFAKFSDIVYRSHGQRELDSELCEIINNGVEMADNNILTNAQDGYEVIEEIPKLPDRKEYPRGQPLTKKQWEDLLDSEGRLEDVHSVKLVIFRGGISPDLRSTVWKYLLDYYKWTDTYQSHIKLLEKQVEEYHVMKMQWQTMTKMQEDNFSDYRERKSLIEKDVKRTDRTLPFFAGDENPNLHALLNILMTYVMYNFDLGYVQGMSDLLSPILYVLKDEVDAFWCFVGFMNKVSSNFDMDQAGMKEQLENLHTLLGFVDPTFTKYLDQHDSSNMFFCFRWMLVWFKRELSMEDTMRLWEVIWTGLPCKNFHLIIAVALLDSEKQTLMERGYGFTEILKHTNDLCGNINIEEVINKAEGIYHQIFDAKHLTDAVRLIIGLPVVGVVGYSSSDSSPFKSDTDSVRTSTPFDFENSYDNDIGNPFL